MPQLTQALDELFALDSTLDAEGRDLVLAAIGDRPVAGLFRFSSPSEGFVAATDRVVIQVLTFSPMLIVTTLQVAGVDRIRLVHQPVEGLLVAIVGYADGEEIPITGVVPAAESGPAERLLRYVSQVTGVTIT